MNHPDKHIIDKDHTGEESRDASSMRSLESSERMAPKQHAHGNIIAVLTSVTVGISSLLHPALAEAAKKSVVVKQTDAQVLQGSAAEKKEENAAVARLKFPKFTTLNSLKTAIQQGKMRSVKDGAHYTLRGIGEVDPKNAHIYATLRPHTKKLADDLAAKFYAIFKKKLTITSLTRTGSYVDILRKTNKNASKTSTHMYGTTLDFTKKGMSQAELNWMRKTLANMERSGTIVATEEWTQPCFHIVDIRANK